MIGFVSPQTGLQLTEERTFLVTKEGEKFPIVKGIPRFTPQENYASAFGLQWNSFKKTQLDSQNGKNISKVRLERCLGMPLESLTGKFILEVGCGAGRFTELLVQSGALVHSIDLSSAVEANRDNIGIKPNHVLAQASVYSMPFPPGVFDVVICLGVIQHTPSPEKTMDALWEMVKPGGYLVIDHYRQRLSYYTTLKPLYRHWLRRKKPEVSKRLVDKLTHYFFPLHWKFRNNHIANWLLHRVSPLIEYTKLYPELSYQEQFEWSQLDSYDSLTDFYKHLRTPGQIRKYLIRKKDAGEIWVATGGNGIEARVKKISP